ncbi:MAG: tetratricopeptide repeat protein [Desulfobacula sp.]|uniref:tetratricopeptide repeat protein n=1 Tax=Desulfobacula sp. TaxID=2593537 RepID=UPI0025C083BD|nr:tetratricopeptide repeat protein [Desulfobacula sp.]MCD4719825.1 tetratricopeptide repeat protein [Desulfobacula sp.]
MKSAKIIIIPLMVMVMLFPSCIVLKKTAKNSQNQAIPAKSGQDIWETKDLKPNHLALAESLIKEGFYDVALVQLKITMDSKNARVYDLAGVCARETENFKESKNYFKKALTINGKNASVHNNLGMLHAMTKKNDEAQKAFEQAVKLDPGRADFLNNLGYLQLSEKLYTKAEKNFKKSLALNPSDKTAVNNLAICLGMQKKDDQTMKLLLEHHGISDAWHNMACIYAMRNEPKKAKKMMDLTGTRKNDQTSAFDIQTIKPGDPENNNSATGMPGDIADSIYTKKYYPVMKQ